MKNDVVENVLTPKTYRFVRIKPLEWFEQNCTKGNVEGIDAEYHYTTPSGLVDFISPQLLRLGGKVIKCEVQYDQDMYNPKLTYGPWSVNKWMYDEVDSIPADYSKPNTFNVPEDSLIVDISNRNQVPYEKIIKEKNISIPKLFPNPEIEEHECAPTGTRNEDEKYKAFIDWYLLQCQSENLGGNDDLHASYIGFLFGIEYQKKLMGKGN